MTSTAQTRRELLDALSELSRLRPQWRLGQTLANLAMTAGHMQSGGVWDLEDEEALAGAKALIEQSSATDPKEPGEYAAAAATDGGRVSPPAREE